MDQRRINRITVLLLALGLGSAAAIYLLAPRPPEDPWPDDPRGHRMYVRQLTMYGGKGNVVSAEFLDWFGGLWHGRNLAGTVAVLTVVAAGAFRFAATPPAGPAAKPAAR